MTEADLHASLRLTLVVFGHISIVVLILCLIMKYVSKVRHRGSYASVYAFGALGGFLGYAIASSREPVAGIVLPALLTFITGLLGYLFSRDNLKTWRAVVPFCISALILNTFLGTLPGSILRKQHEVYEKRYQEWLSDKKDFGEIRKEKEKRILQSKTAEQLEEEIVAEDAAIAAQESKYEQ